MIEVYQLQSTGPGRTIACRAQEGLAGPDAEKRTGWAHIAVTGEWKGYGDGAFEITLDDLRDCVRNFDAQRNSVPFDYGHASEFAYEAPAAGWVQKLAIRNDSELWALVQWTERAAQYIRSGEYRFSSSVLVFGAPERQSGEPLRCRLKSVALTNTPFIDGLEAIALSEGARARAAKRTLSQETPNMTLAEEEKTEGQSDPMAAIGARMLEASGMSAEDFMAALESNLDAVLTALKGEAAAMSDSEKKEDEVPASDSEKKEEDEEDAEMAALKATLKSLSDRLKVYEDREAAAAKAEREKKVDALVADKRIALSDRAVYLRLAEKDAESFEAITKTLRPSYPVGREATAHAHSKSIDPSNPHAVALAEGYKLRGLSDEAVIAKLVAEDLKK